MNRWAPDEDDLEHLPTWYLENENGYREKVAAIVARANNYKARNDVLYADYEAKHDALDDHGYTAKHALLYADYEARRALLYVDYAAIPGAVEKATIS